MASVDEELPWDFYREIHKAARLALFQAAALAGSSDGHDDGEIAAVVAAVDDMVFVLSGHHGHEDDFVDAVITQYAPHLQDAVQQAHRASDAAIELVHRGAQAVHTTAAGAPCQQALHQLYLDLSQLTSMYLQHLDFEERTVLPALQAAMSRDQLMAITDDIRGSVPPPLMCRYMQYMLPGMNLHERADMLGGMSQAPPEVWGLFRAAAVQALSADQFAAVAARTGI